VPPTLEDTLRALAQVVEEAKSIRVELDEEYLRAIAAVEALAQNQSGADKTWVSSLDDAFREHYRRVKRA
jgi:predicted RecB family endonuclease